MPPLKHLPVPGDAARAAQAETAGARSGEGLTSSAHRPDGLRSRAFL